VPKIARERSEENRRRIETAALELFTRQGFHGTNSREIAEKIGISTGAIYTYFPNKKAIYAVLAQKYSARADEWSRQTVGPLKNPLSKKDLRKLAGAVYSKMYSEPEFSLMLLSDVIEFKNQHFQEVFHNMPARFRRILGPSLEQTKKKPGWRGGDPAFALAAIYVYFFVYAMSVRHMQGQHAMGVGYDQGVKHFVDLISNGLWTSRPQGASSHSHRNSKNSFYKTRVIHQNVDDWVDYIRFVCGRLWSLPPDHLPRASRESNAANPLKRPILFLPAIPKNQIDEHQLRIEEAALGLFTQQGFHGTNIREIAQKASVSQGAIYMYYPSKEAIFEGLVRSYRHCMRKFLEHVFRALEDPFSKADLRLFVSAIRAAVYDDPEYWLLMYIDVIEFNNQHFASLFHNMPEQFRRLLGPAAEKAKKQPGWCGQDPALAMAMIYLYFVTYFTIEKVMHGNQHLGVSDEEAGERLVDLFYSGLWASHARTQRDAAPAHRTRKTPE
jgi:AcrR family transcriptional regulator